ncbi:MAG TPA: sensor histidine kinase [Ktedonobacterales bacterium]
MSSGFVGWRSARHRAEQLGQWARAHPLVVDSLLALAIAIPFGWWSLAEVFNAARLPWSLVLGLDVILIHTALAFRRVAPMRSFAVVSLASLGLVLIPGVPVIPPSMMVFLFSLYAYCAYDGWRWAPAFGLVVGAAGAGVLTAQLEISGQVTTVNVLPVVWFGTMFAAALAAWSLGLFRRIQRAYVATLVDRAARAEAEREERAQRAVLDERARIAREMHDVIAHSLAVIVSQAQGGQYAARTDTRKAAEVLATIAESGRQALADMRGLLGVLRSDIPTTTGTMETTSDSRTPQPSLRELPDLLAAVRAAGLPVHYNEVGAAFTLSPTAELAIYRVVQEALTNTLKHAGPDAHADVQFIWGSDGITITVRDTGHGHLAAEGSGHGLIGMRERITAVGGSVTAEPSPGSGFVVRAWLPRHMELAESGQEVRA